MPQLPASVPTTRIASTDAIATFSRVPSGRVVRLEGVSKIVPFTRPPAPVLPPPPDPVPVLARSAGISRLAAPAAGGVVSGILTTTTELAHGQSLQHSVAIGAADAVGTTIGQVIGGSIGSAVGPIGTVVGATIGGLVVGTIAREATRALLTPPPAVQQVLPPRAAFSNPANFKTRRLLFKILLGRFRTDVNPSYYELFDFIFTIVAHPPSLEYPWNAYPNLAVTVYQTINGTRFAIGASTYNGEIAYFPSGTSEWLNTYEGYPFSLEPPPSASSVSPNQTPPNTLPAPATVPEKMPERVDPLRKADDREYVPFRRKSTPETPTPTPTPEPEPQPAPEPEPEPQPNPPPPQSDPPAPSVPEPEPTPEPTPTPKTPERPQQVPPTVPQVNPPVAPEQIPAPIRYPQPLSPVPAGDPIVIPTPATDPIVAPEQIPAPIRYPQPLSPVPAGDPIVIPTPATDPIVAPGTAPKTTPTPGVTPQVTPSTPVTPNPTRPFPVVPQQIPTGVPSTQPVTAPTPARSPDWLPTPSPNDPTPSIDPPSQPAPTPTIDPNAPSTPAVPTPAGTPNAKPPDVSAAGIVGLIPLAILGLSQLGNAPKPFGTPAATPNAPISPTSPGAIEPYKKPEIIKDPEVVDGEFVEECKDLDPCTRAIANNSLSAKNAAKANGQAIAKVAGELTKALAEVPVPVKKFLRCENDAPVFGTETVFCAPNAIGMTVKMFEKLADIEGKFCERQDAIATVPEWWELKPEAKRKQAVLVFREVRSDRTLGRDYYAMTIPHFDRSSPPATPPLLTYKKGNFEGILTLKDNSKLIVNCESATECKRVIEELKKFIDSNQLTNSSIKVGERIGMPFKQIIVKAFRLDYYPTGVKSLKPAWVKAYS